MELEESSIEFNPAPDLRPLIPEPPPVRLVTVEDATLFAPAGMEVQLDAFYVGLLKFERESGSDIFYRAENFRLRFEIIERDPQRENLRPLGIEVPRLTALERQLFEREIEYTRQRGITPGMERLILQDPAGNWVEIGEIRLV